MEGMEKQLTVIDWLVNELKSNKKKHLGYKNIDIDFKNIIEQAKEKENQQNQLWWAKGWQKGHLSTLQENTETFKSEQ
jgi:hypothetical protein